MTNPNNTYIGNAVAGGTHHGWWYRLLENPDGPSFSSTYCPKNIPMGKFYNNSVHSNGRFGLWIFPGYHPTVSGSCTDTRPSAAVFNHLTSYLNTKGAEWVMANNIQFRNFVVFDQSVTGIETKTIVSNKLINTPYQMTFYDEAIGPLIADTIIVGNSDPTASASISESGLVVAWDRGQLIKSVSFYNFPNSASRAIRGPFIDGTCT